MDQALTLLPRYVDIHPKVACAALQPACTQCCAAHNTVGKCGHGWLFCKRSVKCVSIWKGVSILNLCSNAGMVSDGAQNAAQAAEPALSPLQRAAAIASGLPNKLVKFSVSYSKQNKDLYVYSMLNGGILPCATNADGHLVQIGAVFATGGSSLAWAKLGNAQGERVCSGSASERQQRSTQGAPTRSKILRNIRHSADQAVDVSNQLATAALGPAVAADHDGNGNPAPPAAPQDADNQLNPVLGGQPAAQDEATGNAQPINLGDDGDDEDPIGVHVPMQMMISVGCQLRCASMHGADSFVTCIWHAKTCVASTAFITCHGQRAC